MLSTRPEFSILPLVLASLGLTVIVLSTACSEPAQSLVEEGLRTYTINCIACHNPDPKLDGNLGPAVAGSSRELIEARVMRGEYPSGYAPKRDTKLMVALPFLEAEIDGLAAYLESPAPGSGLRP